MYGVDIISVINKAIDSNTRNNATIDNENKNQFVDVTVIIKKTIGTRVEEYRVKDSDGTYDVNSYEKTGVNEFKAGTTYKLSNPSHKAMFENLLINKLSWTDSQNGITYNGADTSEKISRGGRNYDIIYYPAAEFRRATFVCKGVQYSDVTGKVIGMTFEQYK